MRWDIWEWDHWLFAGIHYILYRLVVVHVLMGLLVDKMSHFLTGKVYSTFVLATPFFFSFIISQWYQQSFASYGYTLCLNQCQLSAYSFLTLEMIQFSAALGNTSIIQAHSKVCVQPCVLCELAQSKGKFTATAVLLCSVWWCSPEGALLC